MFMNILPAMYLDNEKLIKFWKSFSYTNFVKDFSAFPDGHFFTVRLAFLGKLIASS